MAQINTATQRLDGQTVIVTGGANGIGAAIVQQYISLGANVVIADLPSAESAARALMTEISDMKRSLFVPVNITAWEQIKALFRTAKSHFGRVDIVVANAGIMETTPFFDFSVDEGGDLIEDSGPSRVIDVNLKGTINTLRLAAFHMKSNPVSLSGSRGSIVLISSTSGFFGGTAVVSYIASKHGVIGLLRSSQTAAKQFNIRINAVAPFITPTFITEGYSERYKERGLPLNTPDGVADAIVNTSLEAGSTGKCYLVAGGVTREIEQPRTEAIASYMGADVKLALDQAKEFFDELGGYPLPKPRVGI